MACGAAVMPRRPDHDRDSVDVVSLVVLFFVVLWAVLMVRILVAASKDKTQYRLRPPRSRRP